MTTRYLSFPVSRSRQLAEKQIRVGRTLFPAVLSILTLICIISVALPLNAADVLFKSTFWQWYNSVNDEQSEKTIISNSAMTITAAGIDVWTDSDQYASYYLENADGAFTAIVKITSQENTNGWAKAGIMVRNAIEPGSSTGYCMVSVTPSNGYAFQWDSNDDGRLDANQNTGSSDYPCWLKLVKTKEANNYKFQGFYSTDGITWTPINTNDGEVLGSAESMQDVGLFVTSHNSATASTVRFEDFEIDPLPSKKTYIITASTGDNGTIYPINAVEIMQNDEPEFTIIPDTGYEVNQVWVDSSLVSLTDSTYTFAPVTAKHTIEATFSQIIYTVTASAGEHGSITPSGANQVAYNETITFDVVPDEGYAVGTVTVDGDSDAKLTNDRYTFENVLANHQISVSFVESETTEPESGIPGCATNTTTDYSSGFDSGDFELTNTSVTDGKLVLDTGNDAIDPDSIVIPFTQEVVITFLYEGAGYVSDFGYLLKEDVVDANGDFKGWNNIPEEDKHPLFIKIYDDNETGGCCAGGNGILDTDYGNGSFPTTSEAALAVYDDGTRNPDGTVNTFVVDGDGSVTAKDMKKSIGTIAGGTELVFFLTANKRWNTTDTSGVFFTKKEWNTDTYGACGSGTFDKIYRLGDTTSESCTTDGGWLAQPAIDRMDTIFGVQLTGEYKLPITYGQKYSHVIVGAPPNDPNKWILGWEDLIGAGDADHNDMVFQIERRTGGIASLESDNAIVPADDDAYFTSVTMTVYDNMPCSGATEINYWLTIDDGDTWIEITNWDEIYEIDSENHTTKGEDITDTWIPGAPQYTKRKIRVDFSEKGLSGRALRWKAEMFSDLETCTPEILDVELDGTVATNGYFSRAEPVIQTNVVYSGAYETPALSWTEKSLRGHLVASQRYDPKKTSETNVVDLWDAGEVLTAQGPGARTLYYPTIAVHEVTEEVLWTGDGTKTEFSGTLLYSPVSALTVNISDQTEDFTDKHTAVLSGSLGGSGTINRFTGEVSVTFNSPPGAAVPIKASYSYYVAQTVLTAFTPANITNSMLGLDGTYIVGQGYTYDFSGDGSYTEDDGDWLVNWVKGYKDGSATSKEWLLGPVDHSVPAVQVPPGKSWWYYGSAVTEEEKAGLDTFIEDNEERQTVVYVGSRDGMLHAFDGGKFRWGDNPMTDEEENRGYFLWEDEDEDGVFAPNYGTGKELWAFIPANLIPRLKNNKLGEDDQAYVDASPTIADVKINDAWATVLLCAQGNGGDTVSCLNVTDPDAPKFMWEFADPDLYRSRSSAAVSQVGRIQVGGQTMWVAFFVSGKTNDPDLYPSIYLVNIETGHLIKRIYLDHDPDATGRGKGGVASGQPAIVDSDNNGYIDRVYVGSDKGYLYKVTIPDDPDEYNYGFTNCVINTDFTDDNDKTVPESYRYQPVYASPAVTVQTYYDIQGELQYDVSIFFGTGDSPYYDEDIDTGNTRYNFYAYTDTAAKGVCSTDTVSLDWFLELDEGHRVYASAFSSAGNIYFGTSTAETEDPCESQEEDDNSGKVYVVDAEEGTIIESVVVGNVRTSPVVDDEHLYVKTTDGSIVTFGGGGYNNEVTMGAEVETSVKSWKVLSN